MSGIAPLELRVIGGMRNGGNASWPLARLVLTPNGVTLGPAHKWLAFLVPTYSFSWEQVTSVDRIRGFLGSLGLQFILNVPVEGNRISGSFLVWPKVATRPIFWIQEGDLARTLSFVPSTLIRLTDKTVWF
jgi:hypothetical protein